MRYTVECSDGTQLAIEPCQCCTNNTIWVVIPQCGLFNIEMGSHALELLQDQITKVLAYHQDQKHIEDGHPPWVAKIVADDDDHRHHDVEKRRKARRQTKR